MIVLLSRTQLPKMYMNQLASFKNMDIYLLDQIFKGHLSKEDSILDAGCGSGRNLIPLHQGGFEVTGFDQNESSLSALKETLQKDLPELLHTSIEAHSTQKKYTYIICNAVLHFAESHDHFDKMLDKLIQLMSDDGKLFIRMTSNIGLEEKLGNGNNGVYDLPDGTARYLLSRQKVDIILKQYQLILLEPVKTVFVDGMRSMTTLVLSKND